MYLMESRFLCLYREVGDSIYMYLRCEIQLFVSICGCDSLGMENWMFCSCFIHGFLEIFLCALHMYTGFCV